MQLLEARVAYLEGLLHESRPDVATDHFGDSQQARRHGDTDGPRKTGRSFASPGRNSGPGANDASDSLDIEADGTDTDLASDVAFLAVSASGREPQYFGPSSALSFSRIASSTLGLHRRHGGSQVSADDMARAQAVREWKPVTFPTPSACERLSSAYFENVHPQYPFLHRPTFEKWKDECMQAQQGGSLPQLNKVPLFFVLMVRHPPSGFRPSLSNLPFRYMPLAL